MCILMGVLEFGGDVVSLGEEIYHILGNLEPHVLAQRWLQFILDGAFLDLVSMRSLTSSN